MGENGMKSEANKNIALIAGQIANGGRTIIFSGVGLPTESGIPDHCSKGCIWDQFRPVYYNECM